MHRFKDKVAIVTGGASGIGREMGKQLGAAGATVVLADLNEELAAESAAQIQSAGGQARAIALDVRNAEKVQALVHDTARVHGRLDYLFNNAGIAVFGELQSMTNDDWTKLIDTNIRGVVHGVQAAYPLMIKQGFGHIVNTASIAGLAPSPGFTAYSMTKHAVVGLSLGLQGEAKAHGVKVSAICPGFIDTPLKTNTIMRGINFDEKLQAQIPFVAVDRCVSDALRGVLANKTIIVVTGHARMIHLLYRMFLVMMQAIVGMRTRKAMAQSAISASSTD